MAATAKVRPLSVNTADFLSPDPPPTYSEHTQEPTTPKIVKQYPPAAELLTPKNVRAVSEHDVQQYINRSPMHKTHKSPLANAVENLRQLSPKPLIQPASEQEMRGVHEWEAKKAARGQGWSNIRAEVHESLTEMQRRLDSAMARQQQWLASSQYSQSEVAAALRYANDLQQYVNDGQQLINKLNADNLKVNDMHEQLLGNYAEVCADYTVMKGESDQLRVEKEQLKSHIAALQATLAKYKAQVAELEKMLDNKKSKCCVLYYRSCTVM